MWLKCACWNTSFLEVFTKPEAPLQIVKNALSILHATLVTWLIMVVSTLMKTFKLLTLRFFNCFLIAAHSTLYYFLKGLRPFDEDKIWKKCLYLIKLIVFHQPLILNQWFLTFFTQFPILQLSIWICPSSLQWVLALCYQHHSNTRNTVGALRLAYWALCIRYKPIT